MILELATLLTPEVAQAAGTAETLNWGFPPNIAALLTLSLLEIVLGVDNIVFIAIVSEKAPAHLRRKVMRIGLVAGAGMRLLLLFSVTWLMKMSTTLFTLWGQAISGKDLVLIAGGGFLLVKSTLEIHHMIAAHAHKDGHQDDHAEPGAGRAAMKVAGGLILQIMMIDLVFSLDSVITAVGMTKDMWAIIGAIVIAVVVMLFAAEPVAKFVGRYPAMKTLALAFLIMIGVLLIADGFESHLPRGYVYFAMVFSIGVELVNMAAERKSNSGTRQDGAV